LGYHVVICDTIIKRIMFNSKFLKLSAGFVVAFAIASFVLLNVDQVQSQALQNRSQEDGVVQGWYGMIIEDKTGSGLSFLITLRFPASISANIVSSPFDVTMGGARELILTGDLGPGERKEIKFLFSGLAGSYKIPVSVEMVLGESEKAIKGSLLLDVVLVTPTSQ